MTKTKLKQNITKITQILQSENYEAGFELLKTLDEPGLTAGLSDVINTTLREKYFKSRAFKKGFDIINSIYLSNLDLSGYKFKSLPEGLNLLSSLTDLNLSSCTKLSTRRVYKFNTRILLLVFLQIKTAIVY